jgi:hypothetical protein
MDRRAFLAGSATALASPAFASATANRTFRIIRDGSDIGTHTLDASLTPDGFQIDITIRIAVKILGVTAYRYELDNREIWKGGQLVSLSSQVNDDGTDDFAKASRRDGKLMIEGSAYSGPASSDLVTTSYYTKAFHSRTPWISTQTGTLLKVQIGTGKAGDWVSVTGDLETNLQYDANGEWVGCEFDAGGETATYEVVRGSGSIGALWAEA